MTDKIFEVRIVHKDNMPEQTRKQIVSDVAKKPQEFQRNFKGFAKVTYVTASPKRIAQIEPIEGTIIDYFKNSNREGVSIPAF